MARQPLQAQLETLALQNRVSPLETPDNAEVLKAWQQHLEQRFGHELLSLTLQVFGVEARLSDLLAVVQQQTALRQRGVEAPQLVALCQLSVRAGRCIQDYGQMRTWLLERGLTPAGWRYLTQGPAEWVQQLAPGMMQRVTLGWLNLAARAQLPVVPALWFEQRIVGTAHLDPRFLDAGFLASPVARDMVAWLRAISRKVATTPKAQQLSVLQQVEIQAMELYPDWLAGRRVIPDNATFASIHRQLEYRLRLKREELETLARENNQSVAELGWDALVAPMATSAGITVTPLATAGELIEEGLRMRHCVGDDAYIRSCLQGHSRIFHLEDGLARATFEAVLTQDWQKGQLKGPGNSAAPQRFHQAVAEILERLNFPEACAKAA